MSSTLTFSSSRSKPRPVGADEHREAAIAVCQTKRYRSLAVLDSSYREFIAVLGYRTHRMGMQVGFVGGEDFR
jgi:hypothetical protein